MLYIGVDPGKHGAVATVMGGIDSPEYVVEVQCFAKLTEKDLYFMLKGFKERSHGQCFAILERLHAMPPKICGVVPNFILGYNYGIAKMALLAAEIPFEEIIPASWQAKMGCRSGGDKNVIKRKAQELFPGLHVTQENGDAIVLAEFCRRFRTGERTDQAAG